MASRLNRLLFHRHRSGAAGLYDRSDALLIGPGGELIAAYGDGARIPAIPEPVTGRLELPATNAPFATVQAAGLTAAGSSATPGVTVSSSAAPPGSSATGPSASPTSDTAESALSVANAGSSTPSTLPASTAAPTSSATDSINTPVSSAPSGAVGSSTISASAPLISLSSSSSPTSTSTAAASATSDPVSDAARHQRDIYMGIAFAAITAAGLLIALCLWFYRIHTRSRRDTRRKKTFWPWDRKNDDPEGGIGIENGYDYGRFGARGDGVKEDRVDGELPYPVYPASQALHVNGLPILASPYRPVQPRLHSIPDLERDLGRLQVANYVPGDVSSDDGSRANSRQGVTLTDPAVAPSPATGSWTVYGPEDGFQNPWPPLRTQSGHGLGIMDEKDPSFLEPPPLATGNETLPSMKLAQDGWAASLRSNIMNAFQAVVGAPPAVVEDNFTRAPERRAERTDENGANAALSRRNSLESKQAAHEPSDSDGLSADHVPVLLPDHDHDPSCLCEWLKQPQKPPLATDAFLGVPSPALIGGSPISIYAFSPNDLAPSPHLAIPPVPVSRAGSVSSLHHAIRRKQLQRGKSKKAAPRHTTLDRMYSSSQCSVGSEMSRAPSQASTASGPLSDQEQFAVRMLRERRKRVADAKRVAARESIRRRSVRLGSKRHGKSAVKGAGNRSPVQEESIV